MLRLDGGSGTIWLKVNKCNAFLYVGRGGEDPDSYQQVNLSINVHKTFEHHLKETVIERRAETRDLGEI